MSTYSYNSHFVRHAPTSLCLLWYTRGEGGSWGRLSAACQRGGMMGTPDDIARYRENLQDEIDSATLYNTLADVEAHPQLAGIYRRLALVEDRHARFWEQKLREAGQPLPLRQPGWRTRTLSWLARRLGPQFVLPTIASMEQMNRHIYDRQP